MCLASSLLSHAQVQQHREMWDNCLPEAGFGWVGIASYLQLEHRFNVWVQNNKHQSSLLLRNRSVLASYGSTVYNATLLHC